MDVRKGRKHLKRENSEWRNGDSLKNFGVTYVEDKMRENWLY